MRIYFYFATNSSYPDVNGRRLIRAFTEGARNKLGSRISITGYADGAGTSACKKRLSRRRADRVKAMLVREGVAAGRVSAVGAGEAPLERPLTNDGKRRIEVRYRGPRNPVPAFSHVAGHALSHF